MLIDTEEFWAKAEDNERGFLHRYKRLSKLDVEALFLKCKDHATPPKTEWSLCDKLQENAEKSLKSSEYDIMLFDLRSLNDPNQRIDGLFGYITTSNSLKKAIKYLEEGKDVLLS